MINENEHDDKWKWPTIFSSIFNFKNWTMNYYSYIIQNCRKFRFVSYYYFQINYLQESPSSLIIFETFKNFGIIIII